MGCLTIDLGASSGRGIYFEYRNGELFSDEIHRFINEPVTMGGAMYWDVLRLFGEIKKTLFKAAQSYKLDCVGIDTWGVDYGLIDKNGSLYSNPRHYRDKRTQNSAQTFPISALEIYKKTGISQNSFNTLYQLFEEGKQTDLNNKTLLFMPQLFGYFLTGEAACEKTIASTGAFLKENQVFDTALLKAANADNVILPPLKSGVLGNLSKDIMQETQIGYELPVVLCPGHDTACAANVLPENAELFLSSGTWSLLGILQTKGNFSEEAFESGFSNERGADGFTFVKNITGMWLEQECKRAFETEGKLYTFAQLENMAKESEESGLISVTDAYFSDPYRMPQRINAALQKTGQKPMRSEGGIMRTIYQSLAMEYAYSYRALCALNQRDYQSLYIIGGGSKNAFLNALTASALQIEVFAGAKEATAIGNALSQMEILNLCSKKERENVRNAAFEKFLPIYDLESEYQKYCEIRQIKL